MGPLGYWEALLCRIVSIPICINGQPKKLKKRFLASYQRRVKLPRQRRSPAQDQAVLRKAILWLCEVFPHAPRSRRFPCVQSGSSKPVCKRRLRPQFRQLPKPRANGCSERQQCGLAPRHLCKGSDVGFGPEADPYLNRPR